MVLNRVAGVLLPVTALPSSLGIGGFSEEAYHFVDWLKKAGQGVWQILPLGPTGYGDSPYQSFSSYAGNPYMISLETLCQKGLLSEAECASSMAEYATDRIRYGVLYRTRYPLLRLAFERSRTRVDRERSSMEERLSPWLSDYALFMAIKSHLGGIPLSRWPDELRLRNPSAMESCRRELAEEIDYQKFMQTEFFLQWYRLKEYANGKGIRMMGDLPIYVSADSADVWQDPELFLLDENGIPTAVAGCPPDGFTPEGQLWGNPIYRWDVHRETGYRWWKRRIKHALSMYDSVRIDHFRGFDSYYSVPNGAPNAVNGHWESGPGMELFEALRPITEGRELIAEDLGYVTESVRELVRRSGFGGMKILQFAFDPSDEGFRGEYLPHTYPENSAAYTGTHDNPTLVSYLSSLKGDGRAMLRDYLWDHYTPDEYLSEALIALLMRSPSRLCIIPMQDYLGLDDAARINRPSTSEGNWTWRMSSDVLTDELAYRVRRLSAIGGRI